MSHIIQAPMSTATMAAPKRQMMQGKKRRAKIVAKKIYAK